MELVLHRQSRERMQSELGLMIFWSTSRKRPGGRGALGFRVSVALVCGTLLRQEDFFSVFSVAKKKPNTEVTEALRVLCVEASEAQRTRRSLLHVPVTGMFSQAFRVAARSTWPPLLGRGPVRFGK